MFGIGAGELVVILIILLLAVGPQRMPTMLRAVGRGVREFRKATRELRAQVGIDELLRDDPISPPRREPPRPPSGPRARPLTDDEVARERPPGGVDLDWARRRSDDEDEGPT